MSSEDKLLQYISPFITANSGLSDHRARLEKIDRLIQRSYKGENKYSCGHSVDSHCSCKDKKTLPPEEDNVTIPVVGPQLSTLSAQLSKVFLRTDPPLRMFSAPAASEIAIKYNILYGQYSRKFQWRRNLLLCVRDAVSYNFCAAEVRWKARAVKTVTNEIDTLTGSTKTAKAFETGESIKHIHPYNVIWDGSVPLNEVVSRGAYAGYVESYTKIALAQFCMDEGIDVSFDLWEKISAAQNSNAGLAYYVPKINAVESNDSVELTHDEIFDGKSTHKNTRTSTAEFNVTTLYIRAIPFDFGITEPNSTDISIIKLIIVGKNILLDYKILDNAHNLFPIIFGQTDESALELNSFTQAEELAPIQNTATKLYNTELASSRRLIADRALYDSNLITKDAVNNPSPTAKIAVKRSMHGSFRLSDAYFPIPYEDRALGVRLNFANSLLGFASQITSANQTMQGQFVKGNKTASEFGTTMAMAGDRLVQSAIFLDDQFFAPLRTILMSDTLQYQNNIQVFNKESGDFIDVDMSELRNAPLDFEIAAGLVPAEEIESLDALQVLIQTIMSREDLSQEFKTVDAICYIADLMGVKYLKRFQKSSEQMQAEMQARVQQQLQMLQAQKQIESQAAQT